MPLSSILRTAGIVAASALLSAGVLLAIGGPGGSGVALTGANLSPEQKKAVEGVVRSYLLENPEVLAEVQSAYEVKMAKEEEERTKAAVAKYASEIYRAPKAPVAGNPNGDITVVEFFDYNCGYCKRGFSEIQKLVDKDTNVRVVFKEFPILREQSEQASRVALAAGLQGKYWDIHRELITAKGGVNEEVALKAAEKLGLDIEKLKADMKGPEVQGELDRVKELAKKLGINGTPHFLVGDRSINGAPENLYDQLEAHVVELRKNGCSYC